MSQDYKLPETNDYDEAFKRVKELVDEIKLKQKAREKYDKLIYTITKMCFKLWAWLQLFKAWMYGGTDERWAKAKFYLALGITFGGW